MTRRFKLAGILGVVMLGLALTAEASPYLSGGFSINGNFLPVGPTGSLADAVGINFISSFGDNPLSDGTFLVTQASGDFFGLAGANGYIKDVTFEGSPNTPIDNFQTIAGVVSFDLLSISALFKSPYMLILGGTGVFQKAGFEDTFGLFNFTANSFGGTFSFSASEGGIPTPEPASLMLVGMGLGFGAYRVRRRTLRLA